MSDIDVHKGFSCDFTGRLFNIAVIASDGYIYEKEYLESLIKESDKDTIKSPTTNKEMKKDFILFIQLNKYFEDLYN